MFKGLSNTVRSILEDAHSDVMKFNSAIDLDSELGRTRLVEKAAQKRWPADDAPTAFTKFCEQFGDGVVEWINSAPVYEEKRRPNSKPVVKSWSQMSVRERAGSAGSAPS